MRIKSFNLMTLFALLICISVAGRQDNNSQDGAKPDRWRGLILDQTTVDDAIKLLGKPQDDKAQPNNLQHLDPRLTKAKVNMRDLIFKDQEGMSKVTLGFIDSKLAMIMLQPKNEIQARALGNIYNIEFKPHLSGMDEAFGPGKYERNRGEVFPKTFPSVYSLLAMSDHSLVNCLIANNSFGSIMRQSAGATDTSGFPGKASVIYLFSKKLENRAGADVLR